MTLRVFRADDPLERETEALLPWYVNGTLDALERARVEQHLAQCLRCRREADWLRALQAAVARDEPAPAMDEALARAHARLDAREARWRLRGLGKRIAGDWREARLTVRAALVVALVLVLALAFALIGEREEPVLYRTLSSPQAEKASGARLSVVFDGAAREDEVRRALVEAGARIIGGPSAAGEYTVEVASADEEQALRKLRASAAVRSAARGPQPLSGTQ